MNLEEHTDNDGAKDVDIESMLSVYARTLQQELAVTDLVHV